MPPSKVTGILIFGLSGNTAKTAKNEHPLYEGTCWDARLPRVDHYDCSNAGAGGWHDALQKN
jgi:hypothetical protein